MDFESLNKLTVMNGTYNFNQTEHNNKFILATDKRA